MSEQPSGTDGWNRLTPEAPDGVAVHQMSLNESAFPPLPGVLRAVHATAAEAHLTLDAMGSGLAAAIAGQLDVPAADVLVAPGSAGLLQQLIAVFGAGGGTVHAWPSWEAYPMMAANAGSAVVRVPLRDRRHDLDAMAAAVGADTRLVLVCNPNNPTGTAVDAAAMRRFLGALPGHVTVVVDEAYRDFADPRACADGVELYREDPRVVVVRTFSKSCGLLSLRVGYAVGAAERLAPLRALALFFRVPAVAQAAAVAALAEGAEIRRRCAWTVAERERLRERLTAAGWEVTPSEANFLWLPMTDGVTRFTRTCADHGVLVCGKPGEGVRVTVAGRAANDAFAALATAHSPAGTTAG